MGRRGILASVVAAAVVGVSLSATSLAATSASASPYRSDFPDPSVIRVGATYWAYGTGSAGRNLQVMSSPDLQHWGAVSDPLPHLPSWAAPGLTWAPGVIQRAGAFVMYYTVRDRAAARECISEATSRAPGGPFVDTSSRPVICQLAEGGSIDPSPFVDPSGKPYLLWKSDDDALGRPTHLWAQALTSDARRLVGAAAELLTGDQGWQAPSVEGPAMVSNGGFYYLFYGASEWGSATSGIGYAVCTGVLGPCLNASGSGPWFGTGPGMTGPQAPSVFAAADGTTKMAYAAWTGPAHYAKGGVRSMWIRTLSFGLGGPGLSG